MSDWANKKLYTNAIRTYFDGYLSFSASMNALIFSVETAGGIPPPHENNIQSLLK